MTTSGLFLISSGVPSAIFRPKLRTKNLWQMLIAALMLCSIKQDRESALPQPADQSHGLVDLGDVHARERFVQQQELGLASERHGDTQHALVTVRQRPRRQLRQVLDADQLEDLLGLLSDRALPAPGARRLEDRLPEVDARS